MSRGVGPPSPAGAAALQAGTLLRAERVGAAVPASRLWCRALLLLAACVCVTAVPYSLSALAAVLWGPPGPSASQQGVGDSLVTACGDLLTSGCFPRLQGVVTPGTSADGQSLGTQTVATWTPQTSLQWQSGSGDREGLRLGTAMAVTLSPVQWPGIEVSAPSARLLQTEAVPSPVSWSHLPQDGLHKAGPGSHGATQVPAVTPAGGLGQPAGTAEPQSPQSESEAISRALSEPAVGVPATSQPMSPRASPAQTRAPSTVTGMSSAATGIIPELGQMFGMEESRHSKARTASVGAVPTPAGPPGPTPASPGSVPLLCSTNPALEHGSEPGNHTATTSSMTPPSCLPTSPGAGHAASSQTLAMPTGATLDAHVMSSGSSTSQHSSTAMEHLPAATTEAFSPAELVTKGKPGSTGTKPPASHPFPTPPVLVLPLQFRLLGVTYTPALGSRNSESYQQLEGDVRLMLNQMLSGYKSFLQANVLEFMNGSVVVRGEVLFRGDAPAPTNSHLIRTLITEASKGRSIFSWQLDPQSILSGGFSLENLDPEKLSISLTTSQLGISKMDLLEQLIREVTSSVSALYHVRNFTISQLRSLRGNTEITGDLYLDTVLHADVTDVLEALTMLSDLSMDLTSISVEESKLGLHVYPISFLVTNRHFSQELQDPLSEEHYNLSRELGDVVARALRDYPSFLKAIIKDFLPGSLICHGNMLFRQPAPTSVEVLETLVLSVGPNQALADSDIHVDPFSLSVGEDTLEHPSPQMGFPAYGVALMVIGGLCIMITPVVLVCLGTKRLDWQQGRALWDRRDPEVGIQTLEMDNQGFWTEDPEDGHFEWQNTSA
uniref:SEA domain-containing protein n=1 Tax=Cyanoderma ruficeps TaxID=181631 RepID=A0A8C3R9A4_9PASS